MPTIMLAEDDLTMISLLKTLLGMEGYRVIALDTDDDILEAVRRDRPDLLLMDVHLPHISGLEVMDLLRADEAVKDTSVVMTSGLNLETECMLHGANAFLLKPYMPDDLLGMLKRNLKTS
ncbi:MAG: response regulator [Chloroflexota bacterium]